MKRRHIVRAASIGAICTFAGVAAGVAESSARAHQRAIPQKAAWRGLFDHPGGLGLGGPAAAGGWGAIHSVSIEPNSTGGFATVTTDAGTITAVGSDSVTVKEGSSTATYATPTITPTGTVTVMLDWKSSTLSALAAGEHVVIVQSSSGTSMVIATDSSAPSAATGNGPRGWGHGPHGWGSGGHYGPNGGWSGPGGGWQGP